MIQYLTNILFGIRKNKKYKILLKNFCEKFTNKPIFN